MVRLSVPPDLPVRQALSLLPDLKRVAALKPFTARDVPTGTTVAESASQATTWRNQSYSEKKRNPTVILGHATGRDEAGLVTARATIRLDDILREWREALLAWVGGRVQSTAPARVVRSLFDQSESFEIRQLADYLDRVLVQPGDYAKTMPEELWRLRLFPDERILDAADTHRRLELNVETRRKLTLAADSKSDQNRIQRLETLRDAGDMTAASLLKFRSTQQADVLQGVELDEVIRVLHPRGAPPKVKRTLDLSDFLDAVAGRSDPERIADALTSLGSWDVSSEKKVQLVASVSEIDCRVELEPVKASEAQWIGDGALEAQAAYVTKMAADETRGRIASGTGSVQTAAKIIEAAVAQDKLLNADGAFESATRNYFEARSRLAPFERWLFSGALETLMLKAEARQAAKDFVDAWCALVDLAGGPTHQGANIIREHIVMLEAVWGIDESQIEPFRWAALSPIHPFLLRPILDVIEYVLTGLGTPQLGARSEWALDRTLPAYPAIWSPQGALYRDHQAPGYEYSASVVAARPSARSGTGIADVIRSYTDFHPYVRRTGLSILLIDPPSGGAVLKNLRSIRDIKMRLSVLTTGPGSAALEDFDEELQQLGRSSDVLAWLADNAARTHLVFFFTAGAQASAGKAGEALPTPGAHVALQIDARARAIGGTSRLHAHVTLRPRDDNAVVNRLHDLAEGTGSFALYALEPRMLGKEEEILNALALISDWVAVGTPGPLSEIGYRDGEGNLAFLGREAIGPYVLHVYTRDLFAIRRKITDALRSAPIEPDIAAVEDQLRELAINSPAGVLRLGRAQATAEHIGVMSAIEAAKRIVDE